MGNEDLQGGLSAIERGESQRKVFDRFSIFRRSLKNRTKFGGYKEKVGMKKFTYI